MIKKGKRRRLSRDKKGGVKSKKKPRVESKNEKRWWAVSEVGGDCARWVKRKTK